MIGNPYQSPKSEVQIFEPMNFKELSFKNLKRLQYHSRTIRAMSYVWLIATPLLFFSLYGLIGLRPSEIDLNVVKLILLVIYLPLQILLEIKRIAFGRWSGIVLCLITMLVWPIGTIFGLLGLVAYVAGGKLFGENKITHKELEMEYKHRRKNKIYD